MGSYQSHAAHRSGDQGDKGRDLEHGYDVRRNVAEHIVQQRRVHARPVDVHEDKNGGLQFGHQSETRAPRQGEDGDRPRRIPGQHIGGTEEVDDGCPTGGDGRVDVAQP